MIYPPTGIPASRFISCSPILPKDSCTIHPFLKGLLTWSCRPIQMRNIIDSLTMSYYSNRWWWKTYSRVQISCRRFEISPPNYSFTLMDSAMLISGCGCSWISFGNGPLTPWEQHCVTFLVWFFIPPPSANIYSIFISTHPDLTPFRGELMGLSLIQALQLAMTGTLWELGPFIIGLTGVYLSPFFWGSSHLRLCLTLHLLSMEWLPLS